MTDSLPPLHDDDLQWDLPSLPPVEFDNLSTLTADEVFTYAAHLQRECATLRHLLHEALTVLARLTRQIEQSRLRIRELVTAARRAKDRVA